MILTILSYTVSKLVRFLRHSVVLAHDSIMHSTLYTIARLSDTLSVTRVDQLFAAVSSNFRRISCDFTDLGVNSCYTNEDKPVL